MRVAVLGSGIVGVSTAWWLAQAGHEVVVVDRRSGPARETSFANGGQISVSYAEPWANSQAPLKLLKWAFRDDAPLLFRPQLDWRQWKWGAAFLRECLPSRLAPNIKALVAMAQYSRGILQGMREALSIDYDHLECGILNFYRDAPGFDHAQKAAALMRDFGVERRILTTAEVLSIEPALSPASASIVGGDYTPTDESGDVHRFTLALAQHAERAGVQFWFDTETTRLVTEGGQIVAAEYVNAEGAYQRLTADTFVVALGCDSVPLVAPLGIACNVYPAKGYSATFPIFDTQRAPTVSLTDAANKVVISRLGNRLRMAGTAEFSGYSRALNPQRCQALVQLAQTLFPEALDLGQAQFWTGLRPTTPSGVPLVGRTRIRNLYLNTGHGPLGWTMGPGSGRALADVISGKAPEPDFPFLL